MRMRSVTILFAVLQEFLFSPDSILISIFPMIQGNKRAKAIRLMEKNILKYKYLYQNNSAGDILVTIEYPVPPCPEIKLKKELSEIDFDRENVEYARDCARRIKWLAQNRNIEDDWVPDVTVEYGQGVHTALLSGGKVSFSGWTSWCEPVIKKWSDLRKLRLNKNNPWLEKIIEANQVLQEMNEVDFFIMPHLYRSPLDYANGFLGNRIWTDLYDNPAELQELLEFCTNGILWLEDIIAG